MREVDRLMVEVYKIEMIQMMENAGRNLARLALDLFLNDNPIGKRVHVLAGSGGNGGGGLVSARRLFNWGADVQVIVSKPYEKFRGVPARQLDIIQRMGIPFEFGEDIESLPASDLIIDAIIGYSLRGAPRGVSGHLINIANQCSEGGTPILSLDVPSGLDSTTGEVYSPAINAAATMTLALPKTGLFFENAESAVGDLYLADISVPSDLYRSMKLDVRNLFGGKEIIKVS